MKRDPNERANAKELIEIVKKGKDADSNLIVSEVKLKSHSIGNSGDVRPRLSNFEIFFSDSCRASQN